jgi:alcohol dehydrogenase
MLTAKLYTPLVTVVIEKDESRLEYATRLGADEVVNPASGGAMERLDELSGEHGFEAVIEAVGTPETFQFCQGLVAPGGSIANIWVHGQKAELALDRLWDRNIGESQFGRFALLISCVS